MKKRSHGELETDGVTRSARESDDDKDDEDDVEGMFDRCIVGERFRLLTAL